LFAGKFTQKAALAVVNTQQIPGDQRIVNNGAGFGKHKITVFDHWRLSQWVNGFKRRGCQASDTVALVRNQLILDTELFKYPDNALGARFVQMV
jgi:hypothetical protein